LRVATFVGLPVLTLELEGVEGLDGLEALVGELALVVGVDEDLEELPHAAMANPAKPIAATDIRRFNGHLAGSSVGRPQPVPRQLAAPRGQAGQTHRQAHDRRSTRCIDALNVGQLNNAQVA
jgi:hypothetical protein